MPPSAPESINPNQVNNPLSVMQHDERVIFELKRSPIGIIMIYLMTLIILVALAVAGRLVLAGNEPTVKSWAIVGFVVFIALSLIFNLLATLIYWDNRWILTSDSITQISRNGLFRKENSQIQIGSIEDVTAVQNGILTRIFNYGTVKVQTAGHGLDYAFTYAPNPNGYARQILETREHEQIQNDRLGNLPLSASLNDPPNLPPVGP